MICNQMWQFDSFKSKIYKTHCIYMSRVTIQFNYISYTYGRHTRCMTLFFVRYRSWSNKLSTVFVLFYSIKNDQTKIVHKVFRRTFKDLCSLTFHFIYYILGKPHDVMCVSYNGRLALCGLVKSQEKKNKNKI